MARDHRRHAPRATSPRIGAAIDLGKTGELLAAGVRRLRVDRGSGSPRQTARRRRPGLQRPRLRVRHEDHPDLRDRLRRSFEPADEGWGPRPVPGGRATPTSPGTSPSR